MSKKLIDDCVEIAGRLLPRHPVQGVSKKFHFSFLVSDGKIMGVGFNRPASRFADKPSNFYPDFAMRHAEADMLNRLYASGMDVINIRLSNRGELRGSKPCPCCAAGLKAAGLFSVWYYNGDSWYKIML